MKRLFYIALAIVLVTTVSCKRKNRSERLYERYLNDSNRVEFVTPSADTVAVEEEVEAEPEVDESEGLFAIPETPEERGVNMKSSDEELVGIMEGRDVEKEAKDKNKK